MKHAAVYCRVSTDGQAKDGTIGSQREALLARAAAEGHIVLEDAIFLDDGYSGGTLLRPALEKLRDQAAEHAFDILYVHSPDRLARKYAYQVLLLEELARVGVSVLFLNHAGGNTPEDALLLQVQGMIAEYEKAKILERSRRGKLHKARAGHVSVIGAAPYGYLYVRKNGHLDARYEILPDEALIVRRMFEWYVYEQLSFCLIARRLNEQRVPTRTGQARWCDTTVWGMLRNPAYCGRACFGKSTSVERKSIYRGTRLRKDVVPRNGKGSTRRTPVEDWIAVAVQPVVTEELFQAAQEQMKTHAMLSQRNKTHEYLLSGLLICGECSYRLTGRTVRDRHSYYTCLGRRGGRSGTRICNLKPFHRSELDQAIWDNVKELLQQPHRVLEEFQRRGREDGRDLEAVRSQEGHLLANKRRAESTLQRLLDGFQAGVVTLDEFKPRAQQARATLASLDNQLAALRAAAQEAVELRDIVTHIDAFAASLKQGLDEMPFPDRLALVRLLVKRVEVQHDEVTVYYRVRPSG